MELFLTLVLFTLLGLLISIGNERQRKAIDNLREQVESWSEQDIKIKREKLAREITVPDARTWLEAVACAALGEPPDLLSISAWQKDNLAALVGECRDGRRLVFTPVARQRLLAGLKDKKRPLSGVSGALLGGKPGKVPYWELSVVSSGIFFDIEAGQVWQAVMESPLPGGRLTMYEVPPYTT